jgi:hypothetical protein
MSRLALLACVLVGCSSNGGGDRAAAVTPDLTCTLFEGVSKTPPPGGVPVKLAVPAGWSRTDAADGSCQFTSTEAVRVSVSLEFCGTDPCNARLEGGRVRATTNRKLAGQTMRTNTLRVQDPTTHYIVTCRANVQADAITAALDAQLQRGAAVCDTLAFTPR